MFSCRRTRIYKRKACKTCGKVVVNAKMKRHHRICHPGEEFVHNCPPVKKDRPLKLCPAKGCRVKTARPDQHLRRYHKFATTDPKYRMYLKLAAKSKKELRVASHSFYAQSKSSASSTSIPKQCNFNNQSQVGNAETVSQYPHKEAINNFHKWLQDREGGKQTKALADQKAQQVDNIFKCLDIDDALEMLTSGYKYIGKKFIDVRRDKSCTDDLGGPLVATSIGPYLFAFRSFCDFMKEEIPDIDVKRIETKLEMFTRSMRSEVAERRSVVRADKIRKTGFKNYDVIITLF